MAVSAVAVQSSPPRTASPLQQRGDKPKPGLGSRDSHTQLLLEFPELQSWVYTKCEEGAELIQSLLLLYEGGAEEDEHTYTSYEADLTFKEG